jgi:hypothetical protein
MADAACIGHLIGAAVDTLCLHFVQEIMYKNNYISERSSFFIISMSNILHHFYSVGLWVIQAY